MASMNSPDPAATAPFRKTQGHPGCFVDGLRLHACRAGIQDFRGCSGGGGLRAREASSCPRGPVKLTAPLSFGVHWVAAMLPKFFRRYPDIAVDLHLTDVHTDLIGDGFDAALRIAVLEDASLVARLIAPVRRFVDRHAGVSAVITFYFFHSAKWTASQICLACKKRIVTRGPDGGRHQWHRARQRLQRRGRCNRGVSKVAVAFAWG
jgi:DNA-binding transcriptional LysR family regulator